MDFATTTKIKWIRIKINIYKKTTTMKVTGTFSLICGKCGQQHDFAHDEVDFEAKYSDERQMGQENGYEWGYSFNCDKNECGNEIEIEYQVWEYPVGAFNHEIINVLGAKETTTFSYDFHEEPESECY